MNIYDFLVVAPGGNMVSLSDYKWKVILIVNTATKCGLAPQFDGLEELYQKYKKDDFIILGFPCNQFANQEPVNDDEMTSVCKMNFGVTFPLFSKIDVNGENESPLYAFLKTEQGGILWSDIKWNFTKFLVDRTGNVVDRYAPTTEPKDIAQDIEKLILV